MSLPTPRWLLLGVVCFAGPIVAAEDSSSAPSAGAKHSAVGEAVGTREWHLNDYLAGTPEHIRSTLNGEVERLIGRIKEAQGEIKRAHADCETDAKVAVDQLHASAAYKQTVAERKQAEADLAAARAGGSAEDRMSASSRFNKSRFAIEKMEKDAIVNCKPLLDDQRRAYELGHEVKRLQEALDKATKWRTELLEAVRNTFALRLPVDVGSEGILPRAEVETVLDGDHVLMNFEAWSTKGPGKEKEGLTSFSIVTKKVRLLLSGVDTKGMKQGDQKNFDRSFVIADKTADGAGTVYVAVPKATDVDKLLDAIVPLRDSLTGSQNVKSDKAD
ncbi:MAG TPA: hypothetical protein VG326_07620 [Tepidisphaeraceae bacterium]|jgi:hypothetical protein|nr:hypothetical protein [Tepidisphaeraceae bacterium]